MSGHSHWSTIKRKKGAEDVKRGKIFSKMGRAIAVAARQGGGDPDANPSLRTAIDKARSYNMPNDKIDAAIKRGTGGGEEANLVEATYEGYGPEGVAFMVKVLTDNKNRTLGEVRQIFEKGGGRVGEAGSVAYIFERKRENARSPKAAVYLDPENPSFTIPVTDPDKAKKVLALANTLDEHDDVQDVYSNFDIPDKVLEQQ
jgi:YebC/PmpR family DNA-binding regulatory protein